MHSAQRALFKNLIDGTPRFILSKEAGVSSLNCAPSVKEPVYKIATCLAKRTFLLCI